MGELIEKFAEQHPTLFTTVVGCGSIAVICAGGLIVSVVEYFLG